MKRRIGWAMLTISVIGWPISAFTLAKNEPQFILGLSWLALIYAAVDGLMIADKED